MEVTSELVPILVWSIDDSFYSVAVDTPILASPVSGRTLADSLVILSMGLSFASLPTSGNVDRTVVHFYPDYSEAFLDSN